MDGIPHTGCPLAMAQNKNSSVRSNEIVHKTFSTNVIGAFTAAVLFLRYCDINTYKKSPSSCLVKEAH